MTTRMTRLLAVAACVAVISPLEAHAQGGSSDAKSECVRSYEVAQSLRREAKLVAARKELMTCAQSTCPELVTADCVKWLAEVEKEVPSIVVSAKDTGGNDTLDVRVTIDGKVSSEKLAATAIILDPGPHDLRFEHRDSVIDRHLILVQGEQNRAVVVSFQNATASTPAKPGGGDDTADKKPEDETADESDGFPYYPAIIAGGVTVVALVPWVIFGVQSSSKKSDYEAANGVAPVNEVEALKSDMESAAMLSNVFMGVTIAGAVATGTLLTIALVSGGDDEEEKPKSGGNWILTPSVDPRGEVGALFSASF